MVMSRSSGGASAQAVTALRRIAYLLEADLAPTYRVTAFRRAADVVAGLDPGELDRRVGTGTLTALKGIGDTTAAVIAQAASGEVPEYLARLQAQAPERPVAGADLVAAQRGDLHAHTAWSDGGSPIEDMAVAATELGHEYLAITDHSPRLTVANGLTAQRLRDQLSVIESLNATGAGAHLLTGIECDILADGTLDQSPELLAQLDVVVASVHSDLRADSRTMTRRMLAAIAHPATAILGHCTGRRLIGPRGNRPPSTFDAAAVFAACAEHGVAVVWTRRRRCWHRRCRPAACLRSTPTRTPRGSWTGSTEAAPAPPSAVCRSIASSPRGRSTGCWPG